MVISLSHNKYGVSSYDDYLGILGANIISRFNIILDYSSSVLYLKPNKNYANPFEFPLSGIKLRKVNDRIIIETVEETSPAYKKGIRKGDQLVSINNHASEEIDVYRSLLKMEGDIAHIIFINSEGNTKKIKIKLTRIL